MRFISRRPLELGRWAMALALILAVGATAADSFREGDKTKAANQDDAKDEPKPAGDSKKRSAEKEAAAKKQRELEGKFKEALTNATLDGRWYLIKDGELGKERREKYSISTATKIPLVTDGWLILARVQYGDKDVTLPVPVRVKWAGDTAVIQVTDAGLPGLGTYTARVMIYNGYYAGTWFGKGYGGILSGKIVKTEKKKEEEKEKKKETPK